MLKLIETDFCNILNVSNLPSIIVNKIELSDFRYEYLSNSEQNDAILKILKKLDLNEFLKVGNKEIWEKGWSENLEDIKKQNDLTCAIPKYANRDLICRLYGKYIKTENSRFESHLFDILRHYILITYLQDCSNIFEVGCGSGQNIIAMEKLYPEKQIYGLDWTTASIDIINYINQEHHFNIKGHIFDVCNPDYSLEMPYNSGVITVGCLEQVYTNFIEFVNFLMIKRPKIVVHFEPILEFYDDDNLIDYLAIKYHQQKNYLTGYYTYLKKLESENKIKIIKTATSLFGNIFNNLWSIIIWEII